MKTKDRSRITFILMSLLLIISLALTGLSGCGSAGGGGGGGGSGGATTGGTGGTDDTGGQVQARNLSGILLDGQGNPVAGATVRVFSPVASTVTTPDGSFTVSVAPGEHSIVISKDSYISISKKVTVSADAGQEPEQFGGTMNQLPPDNPIRLANDFSLPSTSKYKANLKLNQPARITLQDLDLSKPLPVTLPAVGTGANRTVLIPQLLVAIEPNDIELGTDGGTLTLWKPDTISSGEAQAIKIRYFSPAAHDWIQLATTYNALDKSFQAPISFGGVYGIFKDSLIQSTCTIEGVVTDDKGPVAKAMVFAGGSSYVTGDDGFYSLKNVPANQTISLVVLGPGKPQIVYEVTPTPGTYREDISILGITVRLEASQSTLPANGSSTSTVTALVQDVSNRPIIGALVEFSSTLGSITASALTGQNGRATATLTSERTNGMAVITARFLSSSGSTPLEFTGVTLTVTADPPSGLADGNEASTITATLLDASGVPIKGKEISFTSSPVDSAFTISPATVVITLAAAFTDATGKVQVKVRSSENVIITNPATYNIKAVEKVTAGQVPGETSGQANLTFTNLIFTISADAASVQADGVATTNLNIYLRDNLGNPVLNPGISLSSTLGSVSTPVYTDNTGYVSAVFKGGTLVGKARIAASTMVAGNPLYSSYDIDLTPTDPARLTLTASPSVVKIGGGASAGTSTIEARVLDSNWNPVPNVLVSFSIATGVNGGEKITPGTAYTNANGIARTYFVSGINGSNTQNDVTIQARVASITSPAEARLTVGGTPHFISVGYDSATLISNNNGTTSIKIAAIVVDINGNSVVDGTDVNFSTSSLRNSIPSISSPALTKDGVASTTLVYLSNETGNGITVTAKSGGREGSVSFDLPGVTVSSVTLTANPSTIKVDNDLSQSSITAQVKDASQKNVVGINVTFSITKLGSAGKETDIDNPGQPLVGNQQEVTVKSDANGTAMALLTSGDTDGQVLVTVRAGTITANTIVNLIQGSTDTLTLTANPTSIQADGASTSTITALLVNFNHNPVAGATVYFTTTAGAVSAQGITDSQGKATATLTSARANKQAKVSATYNSSNGSINAEIPVAFSGVNIAVMANPGSILANGTSESILTATLRDANNQPIYNQIVNFTSNKNEITITPLATKTDVSGQIQAKVSALNLSGSHAITATAPDVEAIGETVVTFSNMVFTINAGPSTIMANGTATSTLTIKLVDTAGNAVANPGISLSTTLGSVPASVNTDPTGTVVATFTSGTLVGTAKITASTKIGDSQIFSTAEITLTPTPAASINLTASPNVVKVGGGTAGTSALRAVVQDASGNPVKDALVTFSIATGLGGGEIVTPAVMNTNVNGIAETAFISGSIGSKLQNDVTIEARIASLVSTPVSLTVGGAPQYVSVGVDILSAQNLGNGTNSVKVAAIVSDVNGNSVVDGTLVNFSTKSQLINIPVISSPIATKDGVASATLIYLSDDAGKSIEVKGESGGKTGSYTFDLPGVSRQVSTIRVSSIPSSILANGEVNIDPASSLANNQATIRAVVSDSQGHTLGGILVNFISKDKAAPGNDLGSIRQSATTDSFVGDNNGVATAPLTSVASVTDRIALITASSGSASSPPIEVVFRGVAIDLFSDAIALPADGVSNTKVTATIKETTSGVPVANATVQFGTSLGTVEGSAMTDGSGRVTVTFSSGRKDGNAAITAFYGRGLQKSINITLEPAFNITLTADPSAMKFDNDVSKSTISALVKDALQAVVVGTDVVFSITKLGSVGNETDIDDQGSPLVGNQQEVTIKTDANGLARAILTSGDTAGPVVVTAQAGATKATTTVNLTTGDADSLTLTANPSVIQADGATISTITARLVNANNNPIPEATINFSTTFGSISGTAITDSNGKATALLTSARANQQAVVQATYGSVIAKIPVVFNGVNVAVTASPGSLLADGVSTSTITALLRDANNQPIYNQLISFDTTLGAADRTKVTITPSSGRTSATGQIQATVSAIDFAGSATIRATAPESGYPYGDVTISFTNSLFSVIPVSKSIDVGGDKPGAGVETTTIVTATLLNGSKVPIVGQKVDIYTTLGTVSVIAPGATDVNGQVMATFKSGSVVGTALITATATVGTDRLETTNTVTIVATKPESVSVVISPSAVSNNGRTATVRAVVRDSSGNPVGDRLVSFSIIKGPGGGESLTPGAVYTDSSGQATVTFTSGALPSAFNGVQIQATASDVSGTANLTITGPPANVSVGYDIVALGKLPGTFELSMAAVVTDINGNGVADGTQVNLGLRAVLFRADAIVNATNRLIFDYPGSLFRIEDQNGNGIMDNTEDNKSEDGSTGFFANGKLDGQTGAIVPNNVTTASGRAEFKMNYVQSEACYFKVKVTGEAAGVTNDSVFWLPTIQDEKIGCPPDPFVTSYIEPAPATVSTGRTQDFIINNPSSTEQYSWTVAGGTYEYKKDAGGQTIYSSITYTAGSQPGNFIISAVDSHGNTLQRTVTITGPVLTISANPSTLQADGLSTSAILVAVKDSAGINFPDGTPIIFTVTALGSAKVTDIDSLTPGYQQTYNATTTDGVATAILTSGDKPGPVTVTATSGASNVSTIVNLTVGATDRLSLSVNPAVIVADGLSSSTITALLLNGNNNPISGAAISFSTTDGSIPATAMTDFNGRATVTLTSGTSVGQATVTAVYGTLSQTAQVTFTQGEAGTMSVSAAPTTMVANGTDTSFVSATVKDATNTAVSATPVSFSLMESGSVTVLSTPASENVTGFSRNFTLSLGSGADVQSATLTASVRNSTDDSQTGPLAVSINGKSVGTLVQWYGWSQVQEIVITSPSVFDVTGDNTLSIQGSSFDLFDIREVTLSISAVKELGTVNTDNNGVAAVTVTSSKVPGVVTVSAISGALSGSVNIAQTAGPTATVAVSASSATLYADGAKTALIEATVTDANGNLVADGTTVNFATTAGTIGPASATTVNGRVTVILTASVSAVDVAATVTATEPVTGNSGTTTVTFVGLSMTVVADPSVLDADGTSSSQITATLLDSNNNPVSGETILFTVDKGRITGVGTTDSSGQVSVSYTAPVTVVPAGETATITAKVGSLSQTASIALNFAPVMTVSASPASIEVTGGTTTSSTVTATVRDATGAAVSGATVDFTYTALSGVTLAPASGVSNASGQVSTTLTSGTVPGAVTVTATSGQSSVSLVVNITPVGTANGLTLFANPGSIEADGVSASMVTAVVLNATNNPIEGVTVNFATTGGTVTASAVTNASGRAVATLISSTSPGTVTVTATVGVLVQTVQVVFTAGPAASVTLAVTEASGVPNDGIVAADGSSTATVTATVVDGQGNAVGNTAVTFSSTLGAITFQVLTNAGGVAQATFTSGTVTGNAIITAQAGSATATTAITLTEAAAGSLVLSASPSSIMANGVSTSNITAVLLNATNNPVINGLISFSTDRGSIIGSAVTDGNGRAAVSLTSGTSAGTATVTATYDSLAPVTVQVTFTPDATGTLTVSAVPATITANGASTSTVTATVKDASGNNQASVPVSFSAVQEGLVTLLSGPAQEKLGSLSSDFTLTLGGGVLSSGSLTVWTRNSSGDNLSGTLTVSINGTLVGSVSQPSAGGYQKQTLSLEDLSMVDTTAVGVNTLTIQGEPFDLFDLRDMALSLTSNLNLGSATTNALGQAAVTVTSSLAPGIVTVSAISGALSGTVNITQRAGATDMVEVWANPTSIYADGARTSVIEATVTDVNGNLVADGTTVNFATTAGTISPASATTVNGRATVILTASVSAVDVAATVTATEPVTGNSGTTTVTFTGLSLTVVADPSVLDADGTSSSQITATLLDSSNNPVVGETVLFTVDKGRITGVGTTDSSGQVSVSYTAPVTVVPAGETATVTATVGSLPQTASVSLNFAPVMTVSASPTSIEVTGGATTSSVITALVRDSSGQNVPNGTAVTFTVTALGNVDITDIDSATLGDQQTFITTTASGVATATLSSGDIQGPATVTVTLGTGSASVVVNITGIGAQESLTLFSNPGSIIADGVSTSTVTAVLLNSTNNPIAGATVAFVTNSGTITASATTDASGRATATLTSSTTPGTATITASSGTLSQTTSVVFSTGPAASITLVVTEAYGTANDSIIPADGSATATVQATVSDSNGKTLSNTVVTFTTTLGSMTSQAVTNGAGQATATFTAGTSSGNATITVQSGSATSTAVITLTPGTVNTIVLILTSASNIAVRGSGLADTATLTFEARDNNGNKVNDGQTVKFTFEGGTPGGGENLSPTQASTVGGQVASTLRSGFKAGAVKIRAYVDADGDGIFDQGEVASEAVSIAISGGLPDGLNMSMGLETLNIAGLKTLGLTDDMTVYVSDKYNNPVPDGTAIKFDTDYAGITGSSVTTTTNGSSQAQATITSQGPLPPDGFVTVSASSQSGIWARVISMAVEPGDSDVVYAGTDGGGIFKSTDGGTTWLQVGTPDTGLLNGIVRDLQIHSGNVNIIYAATDGGVFRSASKGELWEERNGRSEIKGESLGNGTGAAGSEYALDYPGDRNRAKTKVTIAGTENDNYTYTSDTSIKLISTAVAAANGQSIYIDYTVGALLPDNPSVRAIAINPVTPTTIYAAIFGKGIFKSTNSGISWQEINVGLSEINVISLVATSNTTLYAGTMGSGLYRSTTADQAVPTWSVRNGTAPNDLKASVINTMAIDPLTAADADDVIYVGSALGGVSWSNDGGNSWNVSATNVDSSNAQNTFVTKIVIDPNTLGAVNTLFAATLGDGTLAIEGNTAEGGLFRSTDSGVTWARIPALPTQGLPDNQVRSLGIGSEAANYLYLGADGRNLIKSPVVGITGATLSLANGTAPNNITNHIYTTAEVLFSGSTAPVTIIQLGDSYQGDGAFDTIYNLGSQTFVFVVADANGNPLTAGSTVGVAVTNGSGSLSGDTSVTIPDALRGNTVFTVDWNTNEITVPADVIGTLTVTVTSSANGSVSSNISRTLYKPVAVNPTTRSVNSGATDITITASGGSNTSYTWDVSGGTVTGITANTVTFTAPVILTGSTTVTATATDDINGQYATATITVTP